MAAKGTETSTANLTVGGEGAGSNFVLLDASGAAELVVPGGAMLLDAEFARDGSDLTLTGPDGAQVLVRDYFAEAEPPVLMTEGGAKVGPDLAAKLAGPEAPGEYAQADESLGSQPIGTVETVEGTVSAIRADGTEVTLGEGASVFQGDVIETADAATVNIVFIDDSTFAMDEDGRMVLDELIFDPTTGDGSSAFSVVQGVFSFVSGEIAKSGPEAMLVDTPVATIGIRGTQVAIKIGAQGEDTVITLLPEADGTVGEISVSNDGGTQILNIANQTTQVASFAAAPSEPQVLDRGSLEQLYGSNFDALVNQDFGTPDEEAAADEEAAEEEEEVLDEEVGEEEEAEEEGEGEEVIEGEEVLEVAELEEEALEEAAIEEAEADEDELTAEDIAALQEIAPTAGGDAPSDDGGLGFDADPDAGGVDIGGLDLAPPPPPPPPAPPPVDARGRDPGYDDIVLAPPTAQAPVLDVAEATAAEDTEIPLDITASLSDIDGDETLEVTISDIPDGATIVIDGTAIEFDPEGIDDSTNTITLVDVTQEQLDTLTLTPPPDSNEDFTLTVTAEATEVTGETATTSVTLSVEVTSVADAPVVTVLDSEGPEDSQISLNPHIIIHAELLDPDGSEEITQITISGVPAGAVLSAGTDNGDGSWSLTPEELVGLKITPPPDSSEDFTLFVTATATDTDPDTGVETTATSEPVPLHIAVAAEADAPSLLVPESSGTEDSAIALGIAATLADIDGSETLTVTIAGVPEGATLSAGTDNDDGTWTLGAADLAGLTITPPADSDADFVLEVSATATETDPDTGLTTTVSTGPVDLGVTVDAVADAPSLTVSGASGDADSAIALGVGAALTDTDGSETLSVTIAGVPAGASLSAGTDNGDGIWTLSTADLASVTLTPPEGSSDDFVLTVSATVAEANGDTSTTGPVPLAVTISEPPAPDELVLPSTLSGSIVNVPDDFGAVDLRIAVAEGSVFTVLGSEAFPLPSNGTILTAGGDPVVAGATLSAEEMAGLRFLPNDVSESVTSILNFTATNLATGETSIARIDITVNDGDAGGTETGVMDFNGPSTGANTYTEDGMTLSASGHLHVQSTNLFLHNSYASEFTHESGNFDLISVDYVSGSGSTTWTTDTGESFTVSSSTSGTVFFPVEFTDIGSVIPTVIDQNPCAHLRMPRDMIFHGWSMRLFQAWQHSATMSS